MIDEICAPVSSLKEGLDFKELCSKNEIEFEILPEDCDDESYEERGETSAESVLNFENMQKLVNLNVTSVEEEDGEDGTPFDKYRRKMVPITNDGKVMKYVVKQGAGPVVPENATVFIRYQAYFEYQEVPFDTTVLQNEFNNNAPKSFSLAKSELLIGLHEAILTMKKGEQAEILIHPDKAYGKLGCPPRIPADAFVLFIVELDRFIDCGDALVDDSDMDMEERLQFKHVYKKVKSIHLIAGDKFKMEKWREAASNYKQGINMLHNARLADELEEKERNHFLVKLYTNIAICYNKLKNYKRICCMAADAVRTNPEEAMKNVKLLYNWGFAKMHLGDFDGAQTHLKAAKKLAPQDPEITKALSMLAKKRHDAKMAEKFMYQKAFNYQPSTVKITELSDANKETGRSISEQLETFKANPDQDSIVITDQINCEDEKIWLEVAKDLGLYARVVNGQKRTILIKKHF